MNDDMATFRVHREALSSGLSRWQWHRNHVIMFDYLYKYNEGDKILQKISSNYCLSLYIHNLSTSCMEKHAFEPLKEYFRRTPEVVNKVYTLVVRVPFYFIRYWIFSKVKSILVHEG